MATQASVRPSKMPMIMMVLFLVAALTAACMPVSSPAAAPAEPMTEEMATADIVDTAVAAGSFTTLVAAVQAAGLVDALKGEGPFTVFAPSDEAFAKIPQETIDALLADPEGQLTQILLYHVVPGIVLSTDLSDGLTATTLQGSDVTISLADGAMVNDANIVAADVMASNGVIHVIDTVIMPPAEEAAAVEATEAPAEEMAMADIVDTAVAAGSFNTLVAAVQAAGLVDALKGEGPFTVFAPSDEAFAKIPQETIDALLADPSGQLTQILLYHVVPGVVLSTDLSDGLTGTTLQGSDVTIHLANGAMVNDANIVAADILASNGVIHVIDTVIMPPAEAMSEESGEEMAVEEMVTADIVDTAIAAGSFNTLVAAVQAAGLVDALKGEGPFTVFAPTDEAFAKIPQETIDALLADPSGQLTQILLYHVVPSAALSTDLSDGMHVDTLQGAQLAVHLGDSVMINDATVVAADVLASNGVIHVIDTVLMPPTE